MPISLIPKIKELKLKSIYLYICDIFDSSFKNLCQRFGNIGHLNSLIKRL